MEWYLKHNYICLDWFGSIDHENAYWCIPDMVPLGRWFKLETDDSPRLIEYIRAWFSGMGKEESNFQVQRQDERRVYCTDNFTFKLELDDTLHDGFLYFDPDALFDRKYRIRAFKNNYGERVVYGKNPARPDRDHVRIKGYPVLIILPKTTVIKQRDPLKHQQVPAVDAKEVTNPDPELCACGHQKRLHLTNQTGETICMLGTSQHTNCKCPRLPYPKR